MKTDRQAKIEPGSEKSKVTKKPRKSRSKSSSSGNGNIPLPTYEHAPIGIVECSPDGKHINVNEEFCRFLGYEKEELLGKSLKDITHEDDYALDIKLHQQLVEGKIPFYRLEKRYLHKNGRSIWTELTRSVVCDVAGNPLYTIGVVLDISDRKHVERVLRESVERLRLATEAARMFTWELDLKTRIYTFADSFEEVLGFSGGLLPKNSVETVEKLSFPEDVQAFWDAVVNAIERRGDLHSLQLRVINPETNEIVWLEANAKIVYDEDGNAQRMFGVAQNITESKKAQQEILVISRMPEENPHPVMRLTPDGHVLYANPPSASLLKSWERSGAHAISDELQAGVAEAFASGSKQEVEIEQDGKVFSATLAPIREAGYINFYGSDVTQRRQAERSLRESEERFRGLVNQATAGIIQTDLHGRLTFANQTITEILGYHRLELIGKTMQELAYAGDWARFQELFEQLTQTGKPFEIEQCLLRLDGSTIWASLSMSPLRDASGNMHSTIAVIVDITERKQVEQALATERELLTRIFDTIPVMLTIYEPYTKLLRLNTKFEQLIGWRNEETVDFSLMEEVYPDPTYREEVWRFMDRCAENEWMDIQMQTRDGRILESSWSNIRLSNDMQVGIGIDITERKRTEQALKEFARQQEALYQFTDQLQRTNSLEDIFDAALNAILNALPCDRASILLFDDQDVMSFVAWRGLSDHYRKATNGHSPWKSDAINPVPICMDDVRTADLSDALRDVIQGEGIGALAFIPLVSNGKLIGKFMTYYNAPHVFTEDETELSLTIARQLASGVDRQRAEEALRASEENYRRIVETANEGIWEIDGETRTTFVNSRMAEMLGYRVDEIMGNSSFEFVFPDDNASGENSLARAKRGDPGQSNEFRFRRKDGSALWALVSSSPQLDAAGNFLGSIAMIADITERKHIEQELARERELLERLFATMPVMVSIYDAETQSLRLNDEFGRVLGWKSEEVTVLSLLEALYPDPDYRTQILQRMAAAGRNDWVEVQVQTRDGRTLDSLWANISISKAGQLITGIALGIDITERKQAEEKLRQAAAFDEAVMGNMGEGLYTVDREGKVLSMNPAAEKLFGWTFEELRGRRMHDVTHYKHPDGTPFPAEDCAGFQVLHHGQKLVGHEDVFIRKDGTFFDVIYSSSPLWDNGKIKGLVVVFSDNTVRKQAEKRLVLLSEISDLVRRVEDPNELLFAVSQVVGDHFQARRCLFNEIDLDNDLEIVHRDYCRGVESVAGVHKISDYSSVTTLEIASGKTIVNSDSKTDPRTAQDYERTYQSTGERTYVAVPMMRDHRWVASLWISDDKPRQWSQEEVSLLEAVAERTWAVIEKLRIGEELRKKEAELEAIITETPFMLTRCTRDLRYRFVSRAYAEMIGRSPAEVAGKPLIEIMGEEGLRTISPYIEKVLAGEQVEYESEVPFEGSRTPFLHVVYTPDRDEEGNVIGWFASIVDISERKLAEAALQDSEQRFREIFETAGVSVWLEDFTHVREAIEELQPQGVDDFRTYLLKHPEFVRDAIAQVRILDVNNETLDLFRAKTKQDLLGSLSNVFAPETEQIFVEELLALAEGRQTLRAETQVRALDGRPIAVLFTVHFAPQTGDQSHVVVTLTDITERKRAEESLRASETLYRTIARSIPGGGVYVVDKDMRYMVADGSVTEAFGLAREVLEGRTVSEAFPDERGIRMVERLQRTFAGETVSFETEHKGRVYWTQQAPLSESIGQAIIVTLDITERKRAEEALRQSEERFAQFMEHLPGLAWIKDLQGRYIYANVAAEAAFDTSREKLYGKTDYDIFPPEVADQFKTNDEQALREGKGIQVVETLQQNDGILHYSLVSKFPIPGPDGRTELVGGTAFDITERKRAEVALQESEERFRAILRQATAGIVRKDTEGRFVFVNQAFCNMLGYTESELLGKTVWDFMYPDDILENKRSFERLVTEGVPFKLERRFIREDGSVIWVDASVSPVTDVTGKPQSAVAVEVDITERKRAEEALQLLNLQLETRVVERTAQLQAMNASLQDEIKERRQVELALDESRRRLQILTQRLVEVQEEERRAIARELHDRVGQTLSALNINLIIMKGQILPDSLERVAARFDDSMQLVGETITLVRDVMSNLRPAVLDDYGLEAALQSHVDEYMSRYGIKVIFDRPAQPIPRLGPSIEMTFLRIAQEALMNIARHANATQVILSLWQRDDSVCMAIQDNGSGIVSWQQANRPGSHGLTIMRERAEAFGGNFKVGSIPGKGTKIEMSIPVGRDHQTEVQKEMLE